MSEWSGTLYGLGLCGRSLPESATGNGGQEHSTSLVPAPEDLISTTYHTSRGGNSDGLHVTQAASRESDRHSASFGLDGTQKRNGCVAKTDMPRNDAVTADESSASAEIFTPLYLLASEIVDIAELSEQYRAEERAAAEEGALIEASGYNDPANDPRWA